MDCDPSGNASSPRGLIGYGIKCPETLFVREKFTRERTAARRASGHWWTAAMRSRRSADHPCGATLHGPKPELAARFGFGFGLGSVSIRSRRPCRPVLEDGVGLDRERKQDDADDRRDGEHDHDPQLHRLRPLLRCMRWLAGRIAGERTVTGRKSAAPELATRPVCVERLGPCGNR